MRKMAPRQLVYLDESGDTGFKLSGGSSPTFVVAAVIFDSPQAAEETAAAIVRYRQSIGKSAHFRFHFSSLKDEYRLGLLQTVRDCPFRVRAVVMRKDRIWNGTMLRKRGDYFYSYTCKLLLKDSFAGLRDAKLFIDGKAGRETLRKLVTYLQKQCNEGDRRVFTAFKQVPKRENNVLVQLADMCVGAIARSYRGDRKDPWRYCQIITARIENVFEFGFEFGKES